MARAAVGSTTVTTSPVTGGAPTIASRAAVNLRRIFFTAKDLADPQQLYKVLSDMQSYVYNAIRPLAQNPVLFGNVLGPYTFTGGQTQTIAHLLGRAYVGFLVVGAAGAAWSGYSTTLPAGVSASQMIAIHSVNSGSYMFLVW